MLNTNGTAGSNSGFAWRPAAVADPAGLETVIRRALIAIARTVVNGTADPDTLDRGVGVILAAADSWAGARNGMAEQPADPDAAQHRADLAAALVAVTKRCESCGSGFGKRPRESFDQFSARRFCSRPCAAKGRGADARKRSALRQQECSLGDGNPAVTRGWCSLHYTRWKRHGDPEFVLVIQGDDDRRFLSCLDDSGGPDACHLFRGAPSDGGYHHFTVNGRFSYAHIYAWERVNGPVPDGLQLDHLCHTRDRSCPGGPSCPHRRCVNPAHLEPVTPAENKRRGRSAEHTRARAAAVTHCPNGHEYTPENTLAWKSGGRTVRRCRACVQASMARRRKRAS